MASLQVLLGVLLLFFGYTTAIQLIPSPVYARGQFKCDGKPMSGANVTLQAVINDNGIRPPPWIRIGRAVVPQTIHRHPRSRPHVFGRSLNSTTTDGSGKYLLFGSVTFGEFGVKTTIRLRIMHSCYVGFLAVEVTGIVDIKDLSDKENVSKMRGLLIYEFNADLAHREWPIEHERHLD